MKVVFRRRMFVEGGRFSCLSGKKFAAVPAESAILPPYAPEMEAGNGAHVVPPSEELATETAPPEIPESRMILEGLAPA